MKKITCYLISFIMIATVFFVPAEFVHAENNDVVASTESMVEPDGEVSTEPELTEDIEIDDEGDTKKEISNADISLGTIYYYYTGSERKPVPKVSYEGNLLTNGTDYEVSYSNNVLPGKATMTVTGINGYEGTVDKTFYIAKVNGLKTKSVGATVIDLTWEKQKNVTGYKLYKYNFTTKKWDMIKKIKGEGNNSYSVNDLKAGYGYNFKVRTYVTKGAKTYHGTMSDMLSLGTKPKKAIITSLKADPRKCVTVKWEKRTASGYQVRISRYSDFDYSTTFKVESASTLSRKISNLTADKNYYVKVRAYRTYEGRTTYGQWSAAKKVKTYDTGWLYMASGERYYYKDGTPLKGSHKIDSKRCYFDKTTGKLLGATATMWNKVKNQNSDTKYLIAVSKDTHMVCVYKGKAGHWTANKLYRCSTGARGTATPSGTFKTPGTHMKRFGAVSGYSAWYATRIVGDVCFHSVLYQIGSKTAFVDGRLGLNISHGCIRMNINSAKWIYDNIPAKTKVVIY